MIETHLAHCVESLREVRLKLQELLASSDDDVKRAHMSEAMSFVSKAIGAVSEACEEIGSLADPAERVE